MFGSGPRPETGLASVNLDISVHIACCLDTLSVVALLACSSKHWNSVCEDHRIWKMLRLRMNAPAADSGSPKLTLRSWLTEQTEQQLEFIKDKADDQQQQLDLLREGAQTCETNVREAMTALTVARRRLQESRNVEVRARARDRALKEGWCLAPVRDALAAGGSASQSVVTVTVAQTICNAAERQLQASINLLKETHQLLLKLQTEQRVSYLRPLQALRRRLRRLRPAPAAGSSAPLVCHRECAGMASAANEGGS